MATFPGALPSFTTSDPTKTLDQDNHTARHNSAQEEIVALAAKVGANGSAVATSHDYKIAALETDMTAAEADITTLESDMTAAESDIAAIESAIDNEHSSAGVHDPALVAMLAGAQTFSGTKTFSTTPIVPNASFTTSKIKPSSIESSFTVQGARFTTTSTSLVDVTGCSFTYTVGSSNERLFLTLSVMASGATTTSGQATLSVAGTDRSPLTYHDGTTYSRQTTNYVVDVTAGATVTIKLRAKSSSGTAVNVVNDNADWMPKVTGFAISNV